jgi:hypothetical protein
MNGSRANNPRLRTYSVADIPACQFVQDLERWVAEQRALVLVDRPVTPLEMVDGMDRRVDLRAYEGVELNLVGEVRELSDTVAHGVYDGHLGELSVVVDQYVELRNGIPRMVLFVITHAEGGSRMDHVDHTAYALALMRRLSPAPRKVIKPIRSEKPLDRPDIGFCSVLLRCSAAGGSPVVPGGS